MDLGKRVRDIRLTHGMTLEELGDRLGKSKQYMSELERGNVRLTYEMAVAIARIFATTPDDFLLPLQSKYLGPVPTVSLTADRKRGEQV